MKKLSVAQFLSLLILCRLFVTMTYTPVDSEAPLITIAGEILSTLIQLALIIPPVILRKRFPDRNMVSVGYIPSKAVGIVLSAVYGTFFMLVAVKVLGDFSHFINFAFPVFSFESAIILSMAVGAAYIAYLGITPLSRTSVIAITLFVLMLAIVVSESSGSIDPSNLTLHSEKPVAGIIHAGIMSIGRNTSIVLGCFMLPLLKGRKSTPLAVFVTAKYFIVTLIIFFYSSILGSFARVGQLPFFHLSSYSDTSIVARFDPIFLVVWTMTGTVYLSALIWASATAVGYAVPNVSQKRLCSAISGIVFLIAGVILYSDSWDITEKFFLESMAVFILVTLVPSLLLFVRKEKSV